jgi:hypothetical protein
VFLITCQELSCFSLSGLICIDSIFCFRTIDDIKLADVISRVIHSDVFKMILNIASRLLNMDKNELIVWNDKPISFGYSRPQGWMCHPSLVKSILRHIDNHLNKEQLADLIYWEFKRDINAIKSCTLLSIVNDVQYHNYIENKWYNFRETPLSPKVPLLPEAETREYKCDGILIKNDMFNDDMLIYEYIKEILIQVWIPKCLCDMIVSY